MASKVKNVKTKTHKASAKRFRLSAKGKLMHRPQGGGNGHSNSFKNRRQKAAGKGVVTLNSSKEQQKVLRLIGA